MGHQETCIKYPWTKTTGLGGGMNVGGGGWVEPGRVIGWGQL